MRTGDLCELAADIASEHGACAIEFARRAVITFESEGEFERAEFWGVLSVLLDDIVACRLDPKRPIVIH
jgi:hypothetical protein